MRVLSTFAVVLLGTAGSCAWVATAVAADLPQGVIVDSNASLPAVSGINGKWEFDPGLLTGGIGVRGAGSISIPLSDRFGFQGDVMGSWTPSGTVVGGAAHFFTRDPNSYLLGVTAGIVVAPGKSTLFGIGPEAELYMDRFSLEGWAGVAALNYDDPLMTDLTGFFGFGDIAYYATDDLRLALGASSVLGRNSAHLSAEYLLHAGNTPLSLTGDARLYTTGDVSFTVGLKGYFGGNDDGKSLIDRHRQDDPRNRAVDFFGGSGNLMFKTPGAPPDPEEAACDSVGGDWNPGEPFGYCDLPPLSGLNEEQCTTVDMYFGYTAWDPETSTCSWDE